MEGGGMGSIVGGGGCISHFPAVPLSHRHTSVLVLGPLCRFPSSPHTDFGSGEWKQTIAPCTVLSYAHAHTQLMVMSR